MQEIKEQFDPEGIETPFPHRTLYAGSVTGPLPIHVVDQGLSSENRQSSSKGNEG